MQAEAEAQMSPFAYMGYRGFLDECTGWTGYNAFVNQDYDGDGVADRVLRIYQEESEYCQYQVVFGNGNVLELDKEVYDTGTPWVESADINGDGEQEIIFSQQYGFSTDMRGFGDLAIFEKREMPISVWNYRLLKAMRAVLRNLQCIIKRNGNS